MKNQVEKDGKLSKEAELAVCKLDAVKCIVLSRSVVKNMHGRPCAGLYVYFSST